MRSYQISKNGPNSNRLRGWIRACRQLEKETTMAHGKTLDERLEQKGISRRDSQVLYHGSRSARARSFFWPEDHASTCRHATAAVLCLHSAECIRCTEAVLRTRSAWFDDLIFDKIFLDYHETLMPATGPQGDQTGGKKVDPLGDLSQPEIIVPRNPASRMKAVITSRGRRGEKTLLTACEKREKLVPNSNSRTTP